MRYVRASLGVMRVGIGAFLIFTAIARILMPDARDSLVALYGALGMAPVEPGALGAVVTAFILILGLVMLSGRLLVVAGLLVMVLGLVNGVAELVQSQSMGADRLTLLTLGLRDVLVLAAGGFAIAALDKFVRIDKARKVLGHVVMGREEPVAAPPQRD